MSSTGIYKNKLKQNHQNEINKSFFVFVAEIINKKENPTLLNYMFLDGGFYTAANIVPNCRAFCKLNVEIQELIDLQEQYLNEGLCDFVVSKQKIDSEKYVLLEETTFPYNDTTQTFYLYGLK